MTALRRILAVLVASGGAVAFYFACWNPWHCNILQQRIGAATATIIDHTENPIVYSVSRENLRILDECRDGGCRDIRLYLLMAVNARLCAQLSRAEALYREGLHYDRRPEVYFYLADIQMLENKTDEAEQNYVRAALFTPYFIHEISDGRMRVRVTGLMERERPREAPYYKEISEAPVMDWW